MIINLVEQTTLVIVSLGKIQNLKYNKLQNCKNIICAALTLECQRGQLHQ